MYTKGLTQILIPELSLKYKYKGNPPKSPPKNHEKRIIRDTRLREIFNVKIKIGLIRCCAHFVFTTPFTSVLAEVSSRTKSEPQRGPPRFTPWRISFVHTKKYKGTKLMQDPQHAGVCHQNESRNREHWQILIWLCEGLAGCRGADLTKRFVATTACRRCYKTHLVPNLTLNFLRFIPNPIAILTNSRIPVWSTSRFSFCHTPLHIKISKYRLGQIWAGCIFRRRAMIHSPSLVRTRIARLRCDFKFHNWRIQNGERI